MPLLSYKLHLPYPYDPVSLRPFPCSTLFGGPAFARIHGSQISVPPNRLVGTLPSTTLTVPGFHLMAPPSIAVMRRRHHCRACGHVFCNDCSQARLALPTYGYATEERVCDACFQKFRPDRSVTVEREITGGSYELLSAASL